MLQNKTTNRLVDSQLILDCLAKNGPDPEDYETLENWYRKAYQFFDTNLFKFQFLNNLKRSNMKNKKRIFQVLFFFSCFFSISAISQTGDLTSKELKLFNSKSLGVNEGARSSGTGSVSYSGSLSYSGESWKVWTGYFGSEKISEARFFEIAGYNKISLGAKKRQKKMRRHIRLGLGLGLGGLVAMGLGLENKGIVLAGAGVSMVGIGFMYSGGGMKSRNYKPVKFAYGVAEEYNRALIEQIKKDRLR